MPPVCFLPSLYHQATENASRAGDSLQNAYKMFTPRAIYGCYPWGTKRRKKMNNQNNNQNQQNNQQNNQNQQNNKNQQQNKNQNKNQQNNKNQQQY